MNPVELLDRYADWLIAKSLDIEMRGGTKNYLKGAGLFFGGILIPMSLVVVAVGELLQAAGYRP